MLRICFIEYCGTSFYSFSESATADCRSLLEGIGTLKHLDRVVIELGRLAKSLLLQQWSSILEMRQGAKTLVWAWHAKTLAASSAPAPATHVLGADRTASQPPAEGLMEQLRSLGSTGSDDAAFGAAVRQALARQAPY